MPSLFKKEPSEDKEDQDDQAVFSAALLDANLAVPANIVNPEGKPTLKRFNVYRNNVMHSLIEAMRQGFPAIENLIGQQRFHIVAADYIRNHPPENPLMIYYGATFPDYLAAYEPLSSFPYLPDIAKMEYQKRCAYFAKDDDALPAQWFAQFDMDYLSALTLKMPSAFYVIASPYPIFDIWHKAMDDPEREIVAMDQEVLIYRASSHVDISLVPKGIAQFINYIQHDMPIGQAIEETLKIDTKLDIATMVGIVLTHAIFYQEISDDT